MRGATEPDGSQTQGLVIMYHYVRDRHPPFTRGVKGLSVKEFENQLDALGRLYEPIDWPRFHHALTTRTWPARPVFLLTFDDGLSDHAEIVAPILEARGWSGVFFVPGRPLVEPCLLAAHQIHLLLSALGAPALEEAVLQTLQAIQPGHDYATPERLAEARSLYHYESKSLAWLKYLLVRVLPPRTRDRILETLCFKALGGSDGWWRRWYMAGEQLRQLEAAGHVVGGHGFSHDPLDALSPHDQFTDARRCAQTLNDLLGPAPRPFSFPYGRHTPDVIHAVHAAGFVNAFTTESRGVGVDDLLMATPRIDTLFVDRHLAKEHACPTST